MGYIYKKIMNLNLIKLSNENYLYKLFYEAVSN